LGRTRLVVKEVVDLGVGAIVEIDKAAGEPVDILVNGRLVARGEVVVIEDNFGVRITEILNPRERLARLGEAA
jgi:flagellar motor switch protein FliN